MRRPASLTLSRRAGRRALSARLAAGTKPGSYQEKPRAWTWEECAGCGKQTSVTAGTIMHHSKLPLTAWFWAAYLMATHSNGISALQLQRQLALGSYKSAWLMAASCARSMVAPDRSMLAGLVEVDETEIVCRSKNGPLTGGGGRSHQGKILVAGAVEVEDGGAGFGRIRLAQGARLLGRQPACFPQNQSRPWRHRQDRRMVRDIPARPASITIPMSSATWPPISSSPGRTRIFSNLKVWALGVYHVLRRSTPAKPISTSSSSASTAPSYPACRLPFSARQHRRSPHPSLTRC